MMLVSTIIIDIDMVDEDLPRDHVGGVKNIANIFSPQKLNEQ